MKATKKNILFWIFFLLTFSTMAQITIPVKRANFGIEGGVRANFFNGFADTDDDWFLNTGDNGTGLFVIDTTGAASIFANYITSPNSRYQAFTRGMRYPLMSTVNGRIFYDAVYTKDHISNQDSTSFSNGSKNGMNPATWMTPVSSPVPDKNDISEAMIHIRRNGTTASDSLWFFGGVSLIGNNGNRYFDFELYKTDITYNRTTQKFSNVGPDFGHTSWKFNGSGQITETGDIIFTAEYANSTLSAIEARIWVSYADYISVTPLGFDFIPNRFDGDGSNATFGYAAIQPKNGGIFYTGLGNTIAQWAGPFGTIDANKNPVSNYSLAQFMEFSVNLTKLGLDPMSYVAGSICNLAFSKVLIKTRTSTSFTSSLSDFVIPFSFRSIPKVDAVTNMPVLCDINGTSVISVVNPLSSSSYTWSTVNGQIIGSTTGTSINIKGPGQYVVTQNLNSTCGVNSADTVNVFVSSTPCSTLSNSATPTIKISIYQQKFINISTELNDFSKVSTLVIERSYDGIKFTPIKSFQSFTNTKINWIDEGPFTGKRIYYRLNIVFKDYSSVYTSIENILFFNSMSVSVIYQQSKLFLRLNTAIAEEYWLSIFTLQGQVVHHQKIKNQSGMIFLDLNAIVKFRKGYYIVQLRSNNLAYTQKIVFE